MLKIYLSHSIKGVKGSDATAEEMDVNCERIKLVAMNLRYKLHSTIEIYVPAEHEEFVSIAYRDKYLTEEQILAIDCKIIDGCDVVLCNVEESKGDVLQGGRKVEVNYAKSEGKPVIIFDELDEAVYGVNELMTGHN